MPDQKIINRLSRVGIFGNIFLSAFKLYAGIAGASGAMVSDAVHSLSDVFATIIAWLGVKIASRKADHEHPYGHERFECVASLVLGAVLAVTGFAIGRKGVSAIISGSYSSLAVPTALPLAAAIISIIVKELMYRYTMYYANKLNSAAFKADAWHHRSDALSSVGSFAGIFASRLGYPVMDSVASVIICLFIFKVSYDILRDAFDKMLDTSCSDEFEQRLTSFIMSEGDVQKVDMLHTRRFSSKVYVDVEIAVDRDSSLVAAHEIAERVHTGIEQNFPEVKHVMVHVNPGA